MSSEPPPPDPLAMMRDWMTMWQSEAAAISLDREMQENWSRLAGQWMQSGARKAAADDPGRSPGADAAPGPASPAHASDAERRIAELGAELADLRQRIERLEAARPARRTAPRRD